MSYINIRVIDKIIKSDYKIDYYIYDMYEPALYRAVGCGVYGRYLGLG